MAEAPFVALADAQRRHILTQLAQGQLLTATELAAELGISRQAVSKHLFLLREAGLIQPQNGTDRREHRYGLTPEGLAPIKSWLNDLEQQWHQRLERLKQQIEGQ